MRMIQGPSAVAVRRVAMFLLSSRLLLVSGLLVLVTGVWFAAAFSGSEPAGPLWLMSPISAMVLPVMFWRTSRCAWLPPITRRFWRHLSVAAVLISAGSAVQAVDALSYPDVPGQHTSPLTLSIHGVAILTIMLALFRLPLGRRTAAERLRVTLDAGTVMAATAVFI
jgi:hypothetical protein